MPATHVTVARAVADGWECIDAGRRVVLAPDEIDPALRSLRVGQRLAVREASGRRRATFP